MVRAVAIHRMLVVFVINLLARRDG